MSPASVLQHLLLLLLLPGALGFGILPGKSLSHLEITERAILNVTAQVCRALAQAEGADFSFPVRVHLQLVLTPRTNSFIRVIICMCVWGCACVCRHNHSLLRGSLLLVGHKNPPRASAKPSR